MLRSLGLTAGGPLLSRVLRSLSAQETEIAREMHRFTREELAQYNGKDGAPAYIAYRGGVYDVTNSFLWQRGRHQVLHMAGQDLTGSLDQAPHGEDLLDRVPIVGVLIESEATSSESLFPHRL